MGKDKIGLDELAIVYEREHGRPLSKEVGVNVNQLADDIEKASKFVYLMGILGNPDVSQEIDKETLDTINTVLEKANRKSERGAVYSTINDRLTEHNKSFDGQSDLSNYDGAARDLRKINTLLSEDSTNVLFFKYELDKIRADVTQAVKPHVDSLKTTIRDLEITQEDKDTSLKSMVVYGSYLKAAQSLGIDTTESFSFLNLRAEDLVRTMVTDEMDYLSMVPFLSGDRGALSRLNEKTVKPKYEKVMGAIGNIEGQIPGVSLEHFKKDLQSTYDSFTLKLAGR